MVISRECNAMIFQSTLPLRGATDPPEYKSDLTEISIHTPLAGSDGERGTAVERGEISIHTPLAGSDHGAGSSPESTSYFNPHSPCGERRARERGALRGFKFQSTLPLRGATVESSEESSGLSISIHTPLAGSDARQQLTQHMRIEFQSTLPLRGATTANDNDMRTLVFQSTLPLRGATAMSILKFSSYLDFNPHSPCGERHPIPGQ